MFQFELAHLYIAALLISAVAGIAQAWFGYRAVRYQEDTKRLGKAERPSAQSDPPEIEGLTAEDD
jgi:hypothetical protein